MNTEWAKLDCVFTGTGGLDAACEVAYQVAEQAAGIRSFDWSSLDAMTSHVTWRVNYDVSKNLDDLIGLLNANGWDVLEVR